ncbi:MAG: di-trans,poly-cis-decaprenylcistransferase [Candidatus Aenigmarchaeota archaeon]|nr:di-trans,poly-cis-decaprenylcistransferase [Candidatus Aenigmarchaeota archaeon]
MQVPNHIAVIIDGNRRWATARDMLPWEGHKKGADTLDQFFNWCYELDVPQVSAWVMSTENFEERSPQEISELMRIFENYLEKLLKKKSDFLDKYQVKVRFVGDLERLPPKLVRLMGKVMIKTAKYQKKVLNILINYGGKFDLTQAMKKVAQKMIKAGRIEITSKEIEKNLLLPVPIDLVIRTGGKNRLSDFALWQAAFSEIYVTKTLWPDFSKKELVKAIKWYNSIERNFGK